MELIEKERVGSLELAYLKTILSYEPKCPILAQASGVCMCVYVCMLGGEEKKGGE